MSKDEFMQKVMEGLDACRTVDCWCCPYNGTEACIVKIKEDALSLIDELVEKEKANEAR